MSNFLRWIRLGILVIWLVLLVLGVMLAWDDFINSEKLTGGGYLYNNEGEVIGMWDDWSKSNYSTWLFPVWLLVSFLTDMPLWWSVMYWGIGSWLVFYHVLPHILNIRIEVE